MNTNPPFPTSSPPPSLRSRILGRILTLPFVATAAALALGLVLTWWDRGVELGHVLRYLALVGASLFASQWLVLLVLNVIVAGAWFLLVWRKVERFGRFRLAVVEINRQVGHVEALFAWVILMLVWWDHLWLRLPFATAVAVYGGTVLDWLTRKRPSHRSSFHVARRPLFYAATTVGFLLLAATNPSQFDVLIGLALALAVGIASVTWPRG